MSEKSQHRERRQRSPSLRDDWRVVKIKDEPMSDAEGRGGSKRSKGHPLDDRRGNSRSHSSSDRDRSHRRPENSDRDRSRGASSQTQQQSRRSRSKSAERDARVRGHQENRRDRDRGDRHIKSEPRSRSRSPSSRDNFVRPPPPRRPAREEDDRRGGNRRSGDDPGGSGRGGSGPGGSSDFKPRDPKRERDWANFFNPQSEMSQQAIAKRENNDAERDERMRDSEGGGGDGEQSDQKNLEREKPNFGLSGKLTEETNTYRGVVIKYSEPPEARKPIRTRWRLYPFKDGEALEVMYVHRQSAYLLGRERKIADIPIDHPSCSKQHAVLQYRLVPYQRPNGTKGRRIRPYLIDLESANGTLVNGEKIQPKRYVELFEKDVLKFGFSSREYVLLHEHSKDDDPDDDEDGVERSPSPE